MNLTALQSIITVVLGSGLIGGGAWRFGSGMYRKARAAEELRDGIVAMLWDHEDRVRKLEGRPPLPPPEGNLYEGRPGHPPRLARPR